MALMFKCLDHGIDIYICIYIIESTTYNESIAELTEGKPHTSKWTKILVHGPSQGV